MITRSPLLKLGFKRWIHNDSDSYTCICSNVDKNGGAYRNIKNKNTKGKLNFHITAKRVEVNIN